jgi:hypothetical protein
MKVPEQKYFDATIIGMYRGGATVEEISQATYETPVYVWNVLSNYLGAAFYATRPVKDTDPLLN